MMVVSSNYMLEEKCIILKWTVVMQSYSLQTVCTELEKLNLAAESLWWDGMVVLSLDSADVVQR